MTTLRNIALALISLMFFTGCNANTDVKATDQSITNSCTTYTRTYTAVTGKPYSKAAGRKLTAAAAKLTSTNDPAINKAAKLSIEGANATAKSYTRPYRTLNTLCKAYVSR